MRSGLWRLPDFGGLVGRSAAGALALLAAGLGGPGHASARPLETRPKLEVAEAVPAESASPDPRAPMAVGYKLDHVGGTTRLSFDLSAKVPANAYLLEAPDRVIVDLPQVNFQIDPVGHLKAATAGLIKSFRFGLFAPGRSRIVIDLAGPAALRGVSTVSIAGGDPSRLTIELARTDRDSFHKAVAAFALRPGAVQAAAAPPAAAPVVDAPAKDRSRPVVVIDPGHGGIDPGASGLDGAVEKSVVFDFASALATKLKASGRYTVIMTRTADTFVSLGDRVRIARDANAALFVSIHADTLAVSAAVTGATVYTASDRASDAEAARVAESENQADSAAGVEPTPVASGVNDILFDLTRRETRTYAHLFQRTLVGYWQKIARLNKNPERSAGFRVLQAPDVPSVLLELGYLSSGKDVKALTSPEWRDKASRSVEAAIDAFFAPRQSASGPPAPAKTTAAPPADAQVTSAAAQPNPN